jgi:hypothetical protein
VIFDELMSARSENRLVSRHMLGQKLHSVKGLHPRDAFAVVDLYCDESAPAIPEYLGTEFMVPYLKGTAAVFAVLSIIVIAYSATAVNQGQRQYIWGIVAGVVLLAMSASGWIKSLLREKAAFDPDKAASRD